MPLCRAIRSILRLGVFRLSRVVACSTSPSLTSTSVTFVGCTSDSIPAISRRDCLSAAMPLPLRYAASLDTPVRAKKTGTAKA
jgi:hypothetical protein